MSDQTVHLVGWVIVIGLVGLLCRVVTGTERCSDRIRHFAWFLCFFAGFILLTYYAEPAARLMDSSMRDAWAYCWWLTALSAIPLTGVVVVLTVAWLVCMVGAIAEFFNSVLDVDDDVWPIRYAD